MNRLSERKGSNPAEGDRQDRNDERPDRETRVALFVSLIQHGESVRKAARRSGLSSDQVLQWLEDDPAVAAEMRLAESVIQTQIRFRLMTLAHKAVDTVDAALEDGDARVAVEVLRGLGMLEGSPDR